VATAAALLVGFVAALFYLPPAGLGVLAMLVAAAGAFEWARLCMMGRGAAWLYTGLAAAAVLLLLYLGGRALQATLGAASFFWLVAVPFWLARGVRAEQRTLLVATGFVVLVPAALALALLAPADVLKVLALVWIADTAAYFVGRQWGRRKLAPSISPGKTWEGALGGVLGAVAYAIIVGTFFDGGRAGWPAYFVSGVLLAVISVVGDLFESAVKRQAGAKDSGTLLPGHGGVLDRIDSATAVLPIAALMVSLPNP
jgi:phosphatidate cytidylyltransferase